MQQDVQISHDRSTESTAIDWRQERPKVEEACMVRLRAKESAMAGQRRVRICAREPAIAQPRVAIRRPCPTAPLTLGPAPSAPSAAPAPPPQPPRRPSREHCSCGRQMGRIQQHAEWMQTRDAGRSGCIWLENQCRLADWPEESPGGGERLQSVGCGSRRKKEGRTWKGREVKRG